MSLTKLDSDKGCQALMMKY